MRTGCRVKNVDPHTPPFHLPGVLQDSSRTSTYTYKHTHTPGSNKSVVSCRNDLSIQHRSGIELHLASIFASSQDCKPGVQKKRSRKDLRTSGPGQRGEFGSVKSMFSASQLGLSATSAAPSYFLLTRVRPSPGKSTRNSNRLDGKLRASSCS